MSRIFWLSDNFEFSKKRYCFVCQFQDDFFLELQKIKRFKFYLKHYYKKIVDRIEEMRTFYLEKQYFWTREIHFTVKNDYCNEMIDFLLNLDG